MNVCKLFAASPAKIPPQALDVYKRQLLTIGLLGFKQLLMGSIHLPDYPVWLLIIAGVAFLLLYDFVFTALILFYQRRIKGRGIDVMKLS